MTDFLVVTFYLDKNIYKLFHKEISEPVHVIMYSATNILRQLAKSMEKRLSARSSDSDIFD